MPVIFSEIYYLCCLIIFSIKQFGMVSFQIKVLGIERDKAQFCFYVVSIEICMHTSLIQECTFLLLVCGHLYEFIQS